MVRPVRRTGAGSRKALLILAVIAGGLIWHVLACVESPMAFSPSGKDLAFVTMEPYGKETLALAGSHQYRLMVLTEMKQLRTLEETSGALLTGPGWSPDGKYLAYLRIPLYTQAQIDKRKETAKKRQDLLHEAETTGQADPANPLAAIALGDVKSKEPAPQKLDGTDDVCLPALADAFAFARTTTAFPDVPGFLIVRDAKSGDVVSVTQLDLPLGELSDETLLMGYLTVRPQYDADSRWIYVRGGDMLLAVDPAARKQRVIGAPVSTAALSPDGTIVATVSSTALGLIRTDGTSAHYRRWNTENTSVSGLVWMDKDTVGVLRMEKPEGAAETEAAKAKAERVAVIEQVKADGTPLKPMRIALPAFDAPKESTGELAVAPNGKAMVLAFGRDVFFLKSDGKVASHWHQDEKGPMLADPTFTPDSKHVAFKKMVTEGEKASRAAAIVFYSPDGKEEASADVPADKLPTPVMPAEKK